MSSNPPSPQESGFAWIEDRCRAYRNDGDRVTTNGSRLFGWTPSRGESAYAHVLYAPLAEDGLAELESKLRRRIPRPLQELYSVCNGADLFQNELHLFGLRTSYARTGEAIWQPIALERPNLEERPLGLSPDEIVFGFYADDGSYLAIDSEQGGITRYSDEARVIEAKWPSLQVMLRSAFDALERRLGASKLRE